MPTTYHCTVAVWTYWELIQILVGFFGAQIVYSFCSGVWQCYREDRTKKG